jgi:hypothetical protein
VSQKGPTCRKWALAYRYFVTNESDLADATSKYATWWLVFSALVLIVVPGGATLLTAGLEAVVVGFGTPALTYDNA